MMEQFKIDGDRQSLKEYILQKGCYSPEENLRVFNKWFLRSPRYLFRAVNKKYHLTDHVVCDVGCGYGMNLVYCKPGSYGIDIGEHEVTFGTSLGLTIHLLDVMDADLTGLPAPEAVWCSALLEHVTSIHVLLRKLHVLLKPNGLLVIFVPTIPVAPWLRHLPWFGRYFGGHLYSDHVNGFVPQTLRFFCERAGFRTLEVAPFYPGLLSIFNHVPGLSRLIDGSVYVGRKIDPWEYPSKAARRVAHNAQGFTFIGYEHSDHNHWRG